MSEVRPTFQAQHTALEGADLLDPFILSATPLGPDHPSTVSGLVYAAGNGKWLDPLKHVLVGPGQYREKHGGDYVTLNAVLPAGMEGSLIPTRAYAAQLEAEREAQTMPQLTPGEKLAVKVHDFVKWADEAPRNIRDAVTAAWDSARELIPRFDSLGRAAAATATVSLLAGCTGASARVPETPVVTLYAPATPTNEPTIEATAIVIPPTATEIPPTVTPPAEVRVTPTPSFSGRLISSAEQAAFFRRTDDVSARALTEALAKSNNLVAPVRLADGTVTYPGVTIQTSTELREGRVVIGSTYSYGVINEGPNKGALIGYTYETERDPKTGALLIDSTQADNPSAFILTPRLVASQLGLGVERVASVGMFREQGAFVAQSAQGGLVAVLNIETVDGVPPRWIPTEKAVYDPKQGRYIETPPITGTVVVLREPTAVAGITSTPSSSGPTEGTPIPKETPSVPDAMPSALKPVDAKATAETARYLAEQAKNPNVITLKLDDRNAFVIDTTGKDAQYRDGIRTELAKLTSDQLTALVKRADLARAILATNELPSSMQDAQRLVDEYRSNKYPHQIKVPGYTTDTRGSVKMRSADGKTLIDPNFKTPPEIDLDLDKPIVIEQRIAGVTGGQLPLTMEKCWTPETTRELIVNYNGVQILRESNTPRYNNHPADVVVTNYLNSALNGAYRNVACRNGGVGGVLDLGRILMGSPDPTWHLFTIVPVKR